MKQVGLLLALLSAVISFSSAVHGASFLFNAGKAESTGDADWVIDAPNSGGNYSRPERYPLPDQCSITATSPEAMWLGGYSAWGVELVKAGHHVETLPIGGKITFGNCSNPQDLSHYDVYVIPEPQTRFYDDARLEKQAIFNFVANGGGLFIIANHCGSDRNNNGWDSPMIYNDLGCKEEFGVFFEFEEGSECHFSNSGCSNFRDDPSDPILFGPYGEINPIGLHDATTMTIFPEFNSSIRVLAWKNDAPQGNALAALARCTYGTGRVVFLTDSAPADDGTGDPDDDLINGWSQNRRLILNASEWLAQVPGMSQYTPCPNTTPTPMCDDHTATPVHSPTPNQTPTPTPTQTSDPVSVDIGTNQLTFLADDLFVLFITLENSGPATMVDQYIILEVYGYYYFHPSWGEELDHTNRPLLTGTSGPSTILQFAWPYGAGNFQATFWAALTVTDNINMMYDYDRTTFTAVE